MKKFIVSIFALVCAASLSQAQQLQQLPNDPAVRTGKLDNGLTYYIRHNELPAQRAEFWLCTDAGVHVLHAHFTELFQSCVTTLVTIIQTTDLIVCLLQTLN